MIDCEYGEGCGLSALTVMGTGFQSGCYDCFCSFQEGFDSMEWWYKEATEVTIIYEYVWWEVTQIFVYKDWRNPRPSLSRQAPVGNGTYFTLQHFQKRSRNNSFQGKRHEFYKEGITLLFSILLFFLIFLLTLFIFYFLHISPPFWSHHLGIFLQKAVTWKIRKLHHISETLTHTSSPVSSFIMIFSSFPDRENTWSSC